MPFKSKAQQRFMFAQHPEMAKRWAEHTPNIKDLPEKVDSDEKKAFVTAAELGSLTVLREKAAALDPAIANALGVGGVGALLGAGVGGLTGALGGFIDPGHYDSPDEQGILRRRQRSRLTGMLQQGLGGALRVGVFGGIAGAAAGGIGTEALPHLALADMDRKIESLKNQGAAINQKQPATYTERLQKITDQADNTAKILAQQGQRAVFDAMPRDLQHASLRSTFPGVYSNPLADMANKAVDYGSKILKKYQ